MSRVEQDHVLHVLVDVPWVRLDEVKGVVGDDPTDPVVLCLGAVVLVSLPPAVVQVSSACLTNYQSENSVTPNGLKTFSLNVLVVQTAVVQMSL